MESPLYHPHILETLSGFCNLQAEGVPTLHAEHAGRFLPQNTLPLLEVVMKRPVCYAQAFHYQAYVIITVMASCTGVSLGRAPDKTQQCQWHNKQTIDRTQGTNVYHRDACKSFKLYAFASSSIKCCLDSNFS